MNMDNINKWLTLAANLGVLAGIVFLAIEVQQNNNMMRAQTRDAMTDKLMNWYASIDSNQYTASTFIKGNSGQELDENSGEGLAYSFMVLGNLHMWENELYQYQMGLFDEEEFVSRKALWKYILKINPGYTSVWQSGFAGQYSQDFKEIIEEFISEIQTDETSVN
jgi:hypothetical protein